MWYGPSAASFECPSHRTFQVRCTVLFRSVASGFCTRRIHVADVVVYSDDFALGNKGDRLRLVVSDYGFNRLLKDSLDGLIDIEAGSLTVRAFDYPDITDDDIDMDLRRKKAMLIEAFKTGKPLPEEIRRMIHEADTI